MLALSLTTGFTPRFTLGRSSETISAGAEVATLPRYSPAVRRATIGCRASQPVLSFDESAYEEDRLARDAEAMAAMAVEEAKAAEDAKFAVLRNPWKWVIRRHASQSSEHGEASTPSAYDTVPRQAHLGSNGGRGLRMPATARPPPHP